MGRDSTGTGIPAPLENPTVEHGEHTYALIPYVHREVLDDWLVVRRAVLPVENKPAGLPL